MILGRIIARRRTPIPGRLLYASYAAANKMRRRWFSSGRDYSPQKNSPLSRFNPLRGQARRAAVNNEREISSPRNGVSPSKVEQTERPNCRKSSLPPARPPNRQSVLPQAYPAAEFQQVTKSSGTQFCINDSAHYHRDFPRVRPAPIANLLYIISELTRGTPSQFAPGSRGAERIRARHY